MRPLVTSSMIASILPRSWPLKLTTLSPINVAASMTSGPGPSERRRSAPTIGAPPAVWVDPVVEYELMPVVISCLLAERCLDRLAAGKRRPGRFLRSRVSSSTRDRRQALTLAAGEPRDQARAALTRSVAILFCAVAGVNPALSDFAVGAGCVAHRRLPYKSARFAKGLLAGGSGWLEDLAGNGLGLRHPVHGIGKARVVPVAKSERRRADVGPGDATGSAHRRKWRRVERRPGRAEQRSRISAGLGLRCRYDQPHRRVVVVIGKPGGKDRIALIGQVDAPPRFRARARG